MASIRAAPHAGERITDAPGNISRRSMPRHIISVGLELEGGIDNGDLVKLRTYLSDNGFGGRYEFGTERGLDRQVDGKDFGNKEIRVHSTDLAELMAFLRYIYNECGFATNASCGLHVHVRFADMPDAVRVFGSNAVADEFVRRYSERFVGRKYLDRIYSRHCSDENVITNPRRLREGDYMFDDVTGLAYNKGSVINVFKYSIGTIEFRMLPGQDGPEEAVQSLRWIVATAGDLYETYKTRKIDEPISLDVARKAVELTSIRWKDATPLENLRRVA